MSLEPKETLRHHQFDTGIAWPDGDEHRPRIDLIRTGKKFLWKLNCVILSHDVYRFRTHYIGRTVGCVKKWCKCYHCEQGINERWSGYVGVWWIDKQKFAVLDITQGISGHLRNYLEEHGTLRTARIVVERERDKPTKPVELRGLRPSKPDEIASCPPEFDVVSQLFRIWETKIPKELLRERELQKTHAEQLNDILSRNANNRTLTEDERALQKIVESIPIRKEAS